MRKSYDKQARITLKINRLKVHVYDLNIAKSPACRNRYSDSHLNEVYGIAMSLLCSSVVNYFFLYLTHAG